MLKTPANAGAKGYTQKGVGCLVCYEDMQTYKMAT